MSQWTVEQIWADFYAWICSTEMNFNDGSITLPTHHVFLCKQCGKEHLLKHAHAMLLRESLIEAVGDAAAAQHMMSMNRMKLVTYFRNHSELLPENLMEQQMLSLVAKTADFKELLCRSTVTATRAQPALLFFDCDIHGKEAHQLRQQDWKDFKKNLTETQVMAKLSNIPVVLQHFIRGETALQATQLWEKLPHRKIIATFPKKTKRRSSTHLPHVSPVVITSEATNNFPASHYIIPPSLVPKDILIEYQSCGRKVRYRSSALAEIGMKANGCPPHYSVYRCKHCNGYHYGSGNGKRSPSNLAKSGLRWYEQNPHKANLFIHRIMNG